MPFEQKEFFGFAECEETAIMAERLVEDFRLPADDEAFFSLDVVNAGESLRQCPVSLQFPQTGGEPFLSLQVAFESDSFGPSQAEPLFFPDTVQMNRHRAKQAIGDQEKGTE